MAMRGIEVGVTKTVSSVVYLTLDDEDPKYKSCFLPDGKFDWHKACADLETDVCLEAVKINSLDWDDDNVSVVDIECQEWKEVPADEADSYDAINLSESK